MARDALGEGPSDVSAADLQPALSQGGRPLDPMTRTSMEGRLGHDLGAVRVHSGPAADASAEKLNAAAYTVGHHIVMRSDQPSPSTSAGQRLLAHELVHVVQQTSGAPIGVMREPAEFSLGKGGYLDRVQQNRKYYLERKKADDGWPVDGWPYHASLKPLWKPFLEPKGTKNPKLHGAEPVEEMKPFIDRVLALQKSLPSIPNIVRGAVRNADDVPENVAAPAPEKALSSELEKFRSAVEALAKRKDSDDVIFRQLEAAVRPVDISSDDNLRAVAEIVLAHMPRAMAVTFIEAIDRSRQGMLMPSAAHMQAQISYGQVRPNAYGVYGGLGAQVAAGAVYHNVIQPIAALVPDEVVNAFSNFGMLLDGVIDGARGQVSKDDLNRFAEQLGKSTILTTVFPPIFTAGAAVGFVKGIAEIPGDLAELIENFDEIKAMASDFLGLMITSEGGAIARELGKMAGAEMGKDFVRLSKLGVVEFTYELGKIVGPIAIDIALSLLFGAGAAKRAVQIIGKIAKATGQVAKWFLKILRKWARMVLKAAKSVLKLLPDHELRKLREIFDKLGERAIKLFQRMTPEEQKALLGCNSPCDLDLDKIKAGLKAKNVSSMRKVAQEVFEGIDVDQAEAVAKAVASKQKYIYKAGRIFEIIATKVTKAKETVSNIASSLAAKAKGVFGKPDNILLDAKGLIKEVEEVKFFGPSTVEDLGALAKKAPHKFVEEGLGPGKHIQLNRHKATIDAIAANPALAAGTEVMGVATGARYVVTLPKMAGEGVDAAVLAMRAAYKSELGIDVTFKFSSASVESVKAGLKAVGDVVK